MVSGQRSVVSGQRSAVSGQRSVVSGQWSAVSGQWFLCGKQTQGFVLAEALRANIYSAGCMAVTAENFYLRKITTHCGLRAPCE